MLDGEQQPDPRSGLTALLLSLIVPGLGHWYLSQRRAAIAVAGAMAVVFPLVAMLGVAVGAVEGSGVWVVLGTPWGLRLLAGVHAAMTARGPFTPMPGQTTAGYLTFALVAVVAGWIGSSAVRSLVLEPFKIPSGAMMPTLQEGDHFVASKLSARDREPLRGDIVVFPYPDDPSQTFIKRVLGLPGETLVMGDGPPSIDGVTLDWTACPAPPESEQCWVERTAEGVTYEILLRSGPETFPGETMQPETFVVPSGHVFLVGDNRNRSHDSRNFGPVPTNALIGRASARFLPVDRASTLVPTSAR